MATGENSACAEKAEVKMDRMQRRIAQYDQERKRREHNYRLKNSLGAKRLRQMFGRSS